PRRAAQGAGRGGGRRRGRGPAFHRALPRHRSPEGDRRGGLGGHDEPESGPPGSTAVPNPLAAGGGGQPRPKGGRARPAARWGGGGRLRPRRGRPAVPPPLSPGRGDGPTAPPSPAGRRLVRPWSPRTPGSGSR